MPAKPKCRPTGRAEHRPNASPLQVGRRALATALPAAINQALENYRTLANADVSDDAKTFQQHQTACKAALQHIDALLKLAQVVEVPDAAGEVDHGGLLARAEAAFEAYTRGELDSGLYNDAGTGTDG